MKKKQITYLDAPALPKKRWQEMTNPFLQGDEDTAFRDPTVLYHDGTFYLYYSLVRREENDRFYWYLGLSTSQDFVSWTTPQILTPKSFDLNYSSPGNVFSHNGRWYITIQTLPTPEKFRENPGVVFPSKGDPFHVTGDQNSRIWLLSSDDLIIWSDPRLLRVFGPEVDRQNMGRIIDPYILQDKDDPDWWWCLYKPKQEGMGLSKSRDLEHWQPVQKIACGENVCVTLQNDEYVLFHSPVNGIGEMRSPDLLHWRDIGLHTLGQHEWPWAQKRLTAGFVCDFRHVDLIGCYIMLFHASSKDWDKNRNAHGHCSLGMAWSADLTRWSWSKVAGIESI